MDGGDGLLGKHGDHFGDMRHVEDLEVGGELGLDEGVDPADGLSDLGIKMILDAVVVPK